MTQADGGGWQGEHPFDRYAALILTLPDEPSDIDRVAAFEVPEDAA